MYYNSSAYPVTLESVSLLSPHNLVQLLIGMAIVSRASSGGCDAPMKAIQAAFSSS